MGDQSRDMTLGMAVGMLAHMPWYHYVLMAAIVVICGLVVHMRLRRRYWPQHATLVGIARTAVQHMFILASIEVLALLFVVFVVDAGMITYHAVVTPM